MKGKSLFLFAIFVFIQNNNVHANESLSLEEALSFAYRQNPSVVYARKIIEGAEGDLITAKTWANPEVEAEIGGLKKGGDGSRKGNLDSVSFKQPFDPLGVRSLKAKISQNDIDIQRESLKKIWSEVYVEVRAIYTKVILNKKELELRRSNLKSMRQFFSDVQVRYQGGQALKNHVQRAKIELLKAESDYLKIENELDVYKARMNLLLGRGGDIAFDPRDELKEEQLVVSLDELIDIALAKKPDIRIERILLDSKIKNTKKEQLSRLPAYSLGFQIIDEENESDYAAVVEVSIPLWNLNRGEVKKAKAEREAQEVKLAALKNEIAFEVYVAFQDAQLAMKQMVLFKQSLAEANEMFRLAGLRYGEGGIDFLNYLDQILASMDSRMQYYEGLFQLNQSITALEKAIYSSLREEAFLE